MRPVGTNVLNGSHTTSGAYLFLPDGPALPIKSKNNSFVLIDGPLQKTVAVKLDEPYHLLHVVELDAVSRSVSIRNVVDLTNHMDVEVAMRIKADPSLREFYTELNAYQFIRRHRHLEKLPLQAHFYPMPGAAMVQGGGRRVSLLGRQALGTASLEAGWMEVVLDRRLSMDDGRGLGEGVIDNRLTESRFRLGVEGLGNTQSSPVEATTAFHSLPTYHSSLQLHYPPLVMFMGEPPLAPAAPPPPADSTYSLLKGALPCDVHVVALRTLSERTGYSDEMPAMAGQLVTFSSLETRPRPAAALILHRVGVECGVGSSPTLVGCGVGGDGGVIAVDSVFPAERRPKRVLNATLTLLEVDERKGSDVKELQLAPMEVKSWQVEF